MKLTRLSLAALVAMGAMTCANAKTSLEEAIKGTTISGYVYGQMTSQFGDDIHGNVFRTRAWANVNTGSVGGFSVGMTGYASLGGGKNSNNTSFLEASGAPGKPMPIGLTAVYGNMNFEEYGSKTTIIGGKMNILTAFNDNAWDYGYGMYVSNEDLEGVKFSAQVLGAYTLDDATDANWTAATSLDHPLYIIGVEAGGEKLAGAGVKFYAAHSTRVFDYMIGGDVSYTIAGVTIQSQVAVADVNKNNNGYFYYATNNNSIAELRGLYNIQLAYSNKDVGFSAKGGFTGSFGDGYGALMNYASFNMGGQFWYDTVGSKNGYSMIGAGSLDTSNIMVGYVGVQYTGVKSLKLGLDYAYVGGDNYYVLPSVATKSAQDTRDANHGLTFHEVSFTASYGFFDNKLTLCGLIGSTFGDAQMARGRVKVQYSF